MDDRDKPPSESITPGPSKTFPRADPPGPDEPRSILRGLAGRVRLSGPMLGLLVILGLFILMLQVKGGREHFLSWPNIQGLMHRSAVPATVALGMLLIMISGGIDLSVGSVVALVTVVTMKVFRGLEEDAGVGAASLAAVAAGVAVAGLCGLCNGLAITRLRVTPFVATLGMLSMARGVAVWLAERTTLSFHGERPGWVTAIQTAKAETWLFAPGVWSAFVLAAVVALLLHFTVFGRHCYAVGSNEATARLCGIPVERTKVAVYILAGLLTGWAGVLRFAESNIGNPGAGVGLELEVIAAVVIGGASLSGGQGTVTGTLLGVLILGVLDNAVSFCQVPVQVKYILIGAIVVGNTTISQWQRRRSE